MKTTTRRQSKLPNANSISVPGGETGTDTHSERGIVGGMSVSGESGTSSSPHHVGAVMRIEDKALLRGLMAYVDTCNPVERAFDLGAYNRMTRAQAVRGDALLDNKHLVYTLCDTVKEMRFLPVQLQRVLLEVNHLRDGNCNASSRDPVDWARAVACSIGILCAHARRIRNPQLHRQALTKLGSEAARTELNELRDRICAAAPLLAKEDYGKGSRPPPPLPGLAASSAIPLCDAEGETAKRRGARKRAVDAVMSSSEGRRHSIKSPRRSPPGLGSCERQISFDAAGWPIDPETAVGEAGAAAPTVQPRSVEWPVYSSDAESDACPSRLCASSSSDGDVDGVAKGPAPTKLTGSQFRKVCKGLSASVKTPLSGAMTLKIQGKETPLDNTHKEIAQIAIGAIARWCTPSESVIRIREENSWRDVSRLHKAECKYHRRQFKSIFKRAVQHDYTEDDIRNERALCLA